MSAGPRADFDPIAWFYDRYWGDRYPRLALAALQELLLPGVPPGARLLDLCCGAGHLTSRLAALGYQVTGLDRSEPMLRCARANLAAAAPAGGSSAFVADARAFRLAPVFAGALSTFDSLNYLLELDEVEAALRNVHAALAPGAAFVFDLNMEEAFLTQWHKSSAIVAPDHAVIVRGGYDANQRLGHTDVTMFRRAGQWQREDARLLERCYAPEAVLAALKRAGFVEAQAYDARRDLHLEDDFAVGRLFFRAIK